MNKYQKSLNYISELAAWTRSDSDVEQHKDLIQELIDKETPMKPIKETNNEDYFINCPKCGDLVYVDDWNAYLHRCEWCGQKIDWSEDEED